MAIFDQAKLKGAKAAKDGLSLSKALKERCPYQGAILRDLFIVGWFSAETEVFK